MVTLEEWLEMGVSAGFCSPPLCIAHNLGMTLAEIKHFDAGEDPCLSAVRIHDPAKMKVRQQ
jgi:hypothetical protein